jgi:hypothetical protein
VEIRGRGESGWIRERARLKEPVESELSFAAHPQMLIDIAGMTDTCVVGSGRMLLSGDHFTHVVCLKMRESE